MATELAVGLAIAQQIMQQQGGIAPDLLSPAEAANRLGVSEADVMKIIESGELAAKKIGSAYRIKRSELESYLGR
jgi:excisionase family DNA binding protein